MKTSLRFMAGVCVVAGLMASASAFAAEPVLQKRKAVPLMVAIPALESNDVERLEVRIAKGSHTIVRQTLIVGPDRGERAAIDVLYTHPQELLKLREIEANMPGVLELVIASGERVLARESFAEAESKSGRFALADATGQIESVTVTPKAKTRLQSDGVHTDPACEAQCDADLDWCLNQWCDPRGDSCSYCHTWYWDCMRNCPTVCTDPKSVTTFYTETLVGFFPQSASCRTSYLGKTMWEYGTGQYEVDTWQRTTNCDNSYTDTWVSSHYTYANCWLNTMSSCSLSVGGTPGPGC